MTDDTMHQRIPDPDARIDGDGEDDSTATATAQETKKQGSMIREVVETLLLAVLIFVAVRAVVLNFRVDGSSMRPNLANNEMLLVNRNSYFSFTPETWFGWIPGVDLSDEEHFLFGKPERGDIIVLNPPSGASADKPYIKRVIGESGDVVEIRDEGGGDGPNDGVFVNDQRIDEEYLEGMVTTCEFGQVCGPVTVPEDSVFVLGDNRLNSEDSRVFGVVPIDNVIGKAWVTYWPSDMIGIVPHEDYPELDD